MYKSKFNNYALWIIICIIACYSLLLIKSVSRDGNNFFAMQLIANIVGLSLVIVMQFIDYKKIFDNWVWIGIFSIIIIICTLFFGVAVEGKSGINARAWIRLPLNITFQPSELAKIGFIITFSKHLSILKNKNKINKFKNILLLLLHAIIPVILTHLQGDDGAAIIFLCIATVMLFIAEIDLKYFIIAIVSGICMIPIIWQFVLVDYQRQRLINQINPASDPLNMGYQQIQGMLSIGSGGIFGTGIFKGTRITENIVPIQESDFIFSVAGEELGFIGCTLIILLLLLLILIIAKSGLNKPSYESLFFCFGLIGLIAAQTIFNLGMCLSLLPVMGVTLPFFSYGGSSVLCLYLGISIVQSINMRT